MVTRAQGALHRWQRLGLSLLLLAGACSRSIDACPQGSVRDGDRCAMLDPASPEPKPMRSEDVGPPDEGAVVADADSGPELAVDDPSMDAGLSVDGSSQADVAADTLGTPEAGSPDTSPFSDAVATDAADATRDSNADGAPREAAVGDASPPTAGEQADLEKWRAFQASTQLMLTIADCSARNPRCIARDCEPASCACEAAGVSTCASCAEEEVRCMLLACASECRSSDANDACRACACRRGCIAMTPGCAVGSMVVCADCDGERCTNMSLDPALTTVITEVIHL